MCASPPSSCVWKGRWSHDPLSEPEDGWCCWAFRHQCGKMEAPLVSSHRESVEMCEAVAMLARRISSHYVDSSGLTAFTACRLVALDKCPGVRPIGIGKVLRRIVGKAILAVIGPGVQQVTGALQIYTGQQGGCEAAVHAMSHSPRPYHRSCPLGGCHKCL